MSVLTIQRGSLTGAARTYANAASGGDSFPNSGHELVEFKNTSGAPIVVTFASQKPCNHGVTHNAQATIAAGANVDIGPFSDRVRWNDANGRVQMTYDTNPPTGLQVRVSAR